MVGERKNLVGLGYSLGEIGSFSQKWDCDPEGCQRFKPESFGERDLVAQYQPLRLLVLGDLFHSALNEEWNDFREWLTRIFSAHGLVEFRLVEGNHDVLPDAAFQGLEVQRSARWSLGPFDFVHDPTDFLNLRKPQDASVLPVICIPPFALQAKPSSSCGFRVGGFAASIKPSSCPILGPLPGPQRGET